MPVKFALDTNASRFTVQAFATGMLSSFGHNPKIAMRDYDGEIQFAPDTYEGASVRVTVRTTAMDVQDEMSGDDRKKLERTTYDALEVQRFPTAVYETNQITVQKQTEDLLLVHATGTLSFHGVTQTQSLDARVTRLGTMLRISGDFSLRQSDYAIKPVSFAGGALRLKDELKFTFELVARAQEDPSA
ncbi:MAG TPA: YceI family protein [Candidatus Acidoferrales bacterium]|nr:YceI family protein [Candidatus Acidoferrales bacterium]